MTFSEAETRFHIIDPVLCDKGNEYWKLRLETPAPVEPNGTRRYPQASYARSGQCT